MTDEQVSENISIYRDKMNEMIDGINQCGSKLMTAGQFIDFFIHDVLDYSVLNSESKNFIKINEVFEIKEVI